jgi:hypothetical protein
MKLKILFNKIISTESSDIQFRLSDPSKTYFIKDFIAVYFEWISKWIYIKTGVKVSL